MLKFHKFDKNNTIEDYWLEFAKTTQPDVPHDSMRFKITRVAFYAGCVATYAHLTEMSGTLPEQEALEGMDRFRAEFTKIFKDFDSHSGN